MRPDRRSNERGSSLRMGRAGVLPAFLRALLAAPLACLVVGAGCSMPELPEGHFYDDPPRIIGFAHPELYDSAKPGAAEALAHLQLAISDAAACLEMPPLEVLVVLREVVVVHQSGGGTSSCSLQPDSDAVAAVIVGPGRPPSCVVAPVGSSSFEQSLADAVARYFEREECRPRLL